jgi:hypothetical protein
MYFVVSLGPQFRFIQSPNCTWSLDTMCVSVLSGTIQPIIFGFEVYL